MMSSPVTRRFRSRKAHEIEQLWREFAPTSELLAVDSRRCLLEWSSVALPGISLISYRMAAGVRSSIAPEDQFFTCRVSTQSGGSSLAEQPLSASRPWASDGAEIRARWDDIATVRAVVFDRPRAEALAQQIVGNDQLHLQLKSHEAVSEEASAQWDLAYAYLTSALTAIGDSPLAIAEIQRHALWVALTSFPTTFTDSLERSRQAQAASSTVRRALAFMDANAHLPITVDDVARAVHISTRGLQYAFKRSLDFGPRDYLRRVRLAGARGDLRDSDLTEPLATIARRWGFTNVTRFAARYQDEFGEHPSHTLRAARLLH